MQSWIEFYNFSVRNCCFDAMCWIIFHYFTLCWKWRSFAWIRPLGMHLLLVLLNKPNLLLKIACFDHVTHLHAVFPDLLKNVTSSLRTILRKYSVFPFVRYQNKRLTAIQFVTFCGSAAEESKAVFIKNCDKNLSDIYRVKSWWGKSKDRKCYMNLKFHIYPP